MKMFTNLFEAIKLTDVLFSHKMGQQNLTTIAVQIHC